jgi:carboxypeptidase family protein
MKPSVKLLSSLFSVIVFSLLVSSCSQSNSVSNVQSGSITGLTMLVGNGTGNLPSSAGITVSLDNSNYSAQTDSAGHWEINNVAPGNYNVAFSKSGFGMCRIYGITIEGPGTAYLDGISLGIASTISPTVSNVSISTGTDGKPMLAWTAPPPNSQTFFFVDLDSTVQPGSQHALSEVCRGIDQTPGDSDSTTASDKFGFSVASLYNAGIPSGTKVYLSGSNINNYCSATSACSGSYYDPVHNAYLAISPGPRSNVVALTIP